MNLARVKYYSRDCEMALLLFTVMTNAKVGAIMSLKDTHEGKLLSQYLNGNLLFVGLWHFSCHRGKRPDVSILKSQVSVTEGIIETNS